MPSLALYHYPGASSTFPYLLLEYCGLEYTLHVTDPSDPKFAIQNPKKQVPVLVIDGEIITENPAIAHAINQLAPDKGLFGQTPLEFIRVCEWLNWISATVHAQAWGPYLRPWRFTDDPDSEKSVKASSEQKVLQKWDIIEARLAEKGSWAVGENFTAVDAFLFIFFRLAKVGMSLDMRTRYPNWTAHVDRIREIEVLGKAIDADQDLSQKTARANIR